MSTRRAPTPRATARQRSGRLDFGEVFGGSLRTVFANFPVLLVAGVVAYAPLFLVTWLFWREVDIEGPDAISRLQTMAIAWVARLKGRSCPHVFLGFVFATASHAGHRAKV